MHDDCLDQFFADIISNGRDLAIASFNSTKAKNERNRNYVRYNAALGEQLEIAIEVLVPDAVDRAIFYLMDAIDNDLIKLYYKCRDDKLVNLYDYGKSELAGLYIDDTEEGYRSRLSTQRMVKYE